MGKHKSGEAWRDTTYKSIAQQPGQHTNPALPGFGMRVSPKLKAVWTVKCSVGTGENRQFYEATIGQVPGPHEAPDGLTLLDLEQAHAKAKAWLEEKRMPAQEKEQRKRRGALCIENVLEEFLENRRIKSTLPLSSATKQYYRDVYKRYLQDCKNWSLVELQYSPPDWLRVVQKAAKQSLSWGNGAMALISAIYDYLDTLGIVDVNPIRRVRKMRLIGKPTKRETHIETLDLPLFVKQLFELRNKHSADALKINLLTGWRSTAVLGMERKRVDLQARVLKVEANDLGWKRWVGTYPINRYVLEILKAREAKASDSQYVFPARHGDKDHMQDVRGSAANASKGCAIVATPHILRRTFATVADIVFPGHVALHGALLAHKWATPDNPEAAITLRYTITRERLEAASNRIASVILQIGGIEPMTEETLQLLHAAAVDVSNLKLVEIEGEADEGANDADASTPDKLAA